MPDPLPPRPSPPDPWGHEPGEDIDHQLDAAGHLRRDAEPVARLLGDPKPVGAPLATRTVDPRIAIGLLVVVAIAIAIALVVVLS